MMDGLVNKLEEILRRHLSENDSSGLDLSDDNCVYRKYYFDYLPEDDAREALLLFPCGEMLYKKYQAISSRAKNPAHIDDNELCKLLKHHLYSVSQIMDSEEDEDVINFIKSIKNILPAEKLQSFGPGENVLHKNVYGAVSEFVLNELPDNDAYWILYDWSLEKTKWVTVSAFFMEDLFENSIKGIFDSGFYLWLTGNNNRYWAEGNTLGSNNVFCKAAKPGE